MHVLKYFMQTYPEYVEKMRACSYHYNKKHFNSHHLEGDVWSHTVLAYTQAMKYNVSDTIKWAVVLHDIGRVHTRYKNKEHKTASFGDFEGVSCAVALDILNDELLPKEEIIKVLKIISYHYTMIDHLKFNEPTFDELKKQFKYEEELLRDLAIYTRCDLRGRIIDESRQHYYDFDKIDAFIDGLVNIKNTPLNIEKKPNNAYILVGPPNSGKSTWIKQNKLDAYVVSRDKALLEVGKKYNKFTYDEAYDYLYDHDDLKEEVDALNEEHEEYGKSAKDFDVIFDNPNLTVKHRKEWIDALKDTHNINVVVFLTPFEEMIKRNKNRTEEDNKSISTNNLLRKLKTLQFPLYGENFSSVQYQTI